MEMTKKQLKVFLMGAAALFCLIAGPLPASAAVTNSAAYYFNTICESAAAGPEEKTACRSLAQSIEANKASFTPICNDMCKAFYGQPTQINAFNTCQSGCLALTGTAY
ncbi:MAG: hypothetical protein M0009_12140 [Deltaproteobacteria bacterium]|nr:hypothetical protein [Deltaproteobacteria bacterium]